MSEHGKSHPLLLVIKHMNLEMDQNSEYLLEKLIAVQVCLSPRALS